MAKSNRGGKRTSVTAGGSVNVAATQAMQVDDTQQVPQVQPVQTMSAEYNEFVAMSDDDKATVITSMISQDVPDHLANNSLQRFIYNIGMNDKPDVVDDSTLDGLGGVDIFRTVNNAYDDVRDIGYSADQIVKQVQGGRVTRTDGQASLLGNGIYFANDYNHSVTHYGSTRGNVKQTAVMRAKLNSNAKIILDVDADRGVNAEIRSGTKLGRALSKCSADSRSSIYALSKGYNVIKGTSSWTNGYYNVLNRQAMTMSKDIKPAGSKWK